MLYSGRMITRVRPFASALVASVLLLACHNSPTEPNVAPLASGRWTGTGACLSVTANGCNLVIGCGHGQFPRPTVGVDGTFSIGGTYRIEVGPISIEPAPPAQFSGSLAGSRLTLTVSPTPPLPTATYVLTLTDMGTCAIPCV
jgi:hypothetical protein